MLAGLALAIVFSVLLVIKHTKFNYFLLGWFLSTCCLSIVLILIWWGSFSPTIFYGVLLFFIAYYFVIVAKHKVEKKEEKISCLSSYFFYTQIKDNFVKNFKNATSRQLCNGFLNASFLIYYFSLHHVWFSRICVLILLLFSPKAAILLVVSVFYWGVFLLFVDKNTQYLNSSCLDIKEYLTFDSALQKGLLKLSFFIALLLVLCLLFNIELLYCFEVLSRLCLVLILAVSFNVDLGWLAFPLLNIIIFMVLCYLVVYSYNYSNKSWIFIFNSTHILLYISWCLFVSYDHLAIYYQISLWLVHVCSCLYFFVWLGGLIISLRFYLGSWEFLKQCLEDSNNEPSKKKGKTETLLYHQDYSVKSAMLASHEAKLFLNQNKLHFNKTYMRTIVLVYAYLGWVLDNIVKINGVFALLLIVSTLEGFIFVLFFNTVAFLLIICINCLSYDEVWYNNFKKANGPFVLTTIGWNMLHVATKKIVTSIKYMGPVGLAGVLGGAALGYVAGYTQGSTDKQKEHIEGSGIVVDKPKFLKDYYKMGPSFLNITVSLEKIPGVKAETDSTPGYWVKTIGMGGKAAYKFITTGQADIMITARLTVESIKLPIYGEVLPNPKASVSQKDAEHVERIDANNTCEYYLAGLNDLNGEELNNKLCDGTIPLNDPSSCGLKPLNDLSHGEKVDFHCRLINTGPSREAFTPIELDKLKYTFDRGTQTDVEDLSGSNIKTLVSKNYEQKSTSQELNSTAPGDFGIDITPERMQAEVNEVKRQEFADFLATLAEQYGN